MSYSLKCSTKQIETLMHEYQLHAMPLTNDYTIFRAKINTTVLTVYKTNTVTFQGGTSDELYLLWCKRFGIIPEDIQEPTKKAETPNIDYSIIGTDEVGTGDFFGSVVVAGAYVDKDNIIMLKKMKIRDSKSLSDAKILEIAPKILKFVPYSVLIVDNTKYNKLIKIKSMNLNKLKAILHNNVILNITKKLEEDHIVYNEVIVDGFTTPERYFAYLEGQKEVYKKAQIIPKAEDQYIAVATASVIARYLFLTHLSKLSKACKYDLPKGASHEVDYVASIILKEKGIDYLSKVAKLNFKNYEKAQMLLKKTPQ